MTKSSDCQNKLEKRLRASSEKAADRPLPHGLSLLGENKLKAFRRGLLKTLAAASILTAFFLPGCLGISSSSLTPSSPEGPAMDLAMGLYQRGESLKSLAARGGVNYTIDQQRHYFKFEALVIKPGWLLLTAFDPAGRPAFKLASDGSQLTGIFYGAKQYVTGPATAENFGRFIPLGLSPDQLIALMSGSQVRPAAAGAKENKSNTELTVVPAGRAGKTSDLWRIRLTGALAQNPETAEIQSAVLGSPRQNPEISIKYPSIRQVAREDQGGRPEPFPASVEINWAGAGNKSQSLKVTYEEVRLGLTLDESLFHLGQPAGFEWAPLR